MLATEGPDRFAVTQSTPAMTADIEPEPVHPSTRTGTSFTPLATPYLVPPTMPATWVPCPSQSSVPRPSLTAVKPERTRPPKSV